ncbi:DUF7594 domain-containing protein [Actomonas aquatica]|uniref:DNRLRE domain-containing protein n=1 Tax=Actomonas aquatica TaxID=2866162 RepID=A0ABZ1C3B5_9BACT|nr:DNRLRE domain-containing protein [Opitutus sp. WL0086]WRQ85758.1 DNRLRE domain-containing protein [Opitutus sp. WL0086]
MPLPVRLLVRAAAVFLTALALPLTLHAADVYALPAGAGSQDGSSWANAAPQGSLQTLLDGLTPGDTLYVGSGTYTVSPLNIEGDGTAVAPLQFIGVDTGDGYPVFQGTFDVAVASGGACLRLPTTANYWNIKNLVIRNHRFPVTMLQSGTTYTRYTHLLFENISTDSLEDALRLYNCSDITVRNFSAIRYTKKAFRISDYSRDVLFDSCYADCTGGDPTFPARAIPNSFFLDETDQEPIIHDITFVDCTAKNNGYYPVSGGSYWNGDGFSSERGAYNITLLRCWAIDNWDAGFDNKGGNMTFQDCVATGNMRGFRHWGDTATFDNCLSVNLIKRGGTGGKSSYWIDDLAIDLTFQNCTAASLDGGPLAYIETNNTNGPVVFYDSIFFHLSDVALFTNSNNITLDASTVTYRPGSGVDPQFVDADIDWVGSPANAWNSQTYGTSKGYSSTIVNAPANSAPALSIGASATSGNAPLAVQFTATAADSDGVIVGYAWDLGDGTTSFAQNPSVVFATPGTYTVTCTVTDNRGATTTATTTIHSTAPSSPTAVRIEAGSTSAYTDNASNAWSADFGYDAGSDIVDRGAIAIAGTTDDRIYQTERYDISDYSLLIANGTYTVNLHFAETYSGTTGAGQRVFTAAAEGAIPAGWRDIDIFAQAGGANTALIKSATIAVADNFLDLSFVASTGGTLINGIEILPVGSGDLPPSSPSGVTASAVGSTGFTVSWNAATDDVSVAGYEVFLNGVSAATTTGALSANLTGLTTATTFAVTVRTLDSAGNLSAASAPINVTTGGSADTTPPSTPTGLAASAITTSSFTLSWTASTDDTAVDYYEVLLDGSPVTTTSGTTTSVGGLNPGTSYAATVRAYDTSGNVSASSAALTVVTDTPSVGTTFELTPIDDAHVQAGSNANSNYGSLDNLAVKYQGPTDAQTRESYLKFSLPATSSGYIESATLKLTVKASKDNQTHTLSFVANDAWTESTITWNTKPTSSTILDTVPGSAAALAVVSFDVTSQAISEQAGDGVISLNIAANNSDFSNYYSKEAADAGLYPVLEVVLSAVPPPTTPTNLAATNVTSASFDLSWTASTSSVGIAGYDILIDGVSAGTTTGTSTTVSGLTADTTYAVTVVATDTNGTPSAASSALSVTTAGASGGTYTLTPVHDTFARAGSYAGTSFGSLDNLAIKNQGSTDEQTRESYLRFDLSSLGSGTMVSATLKLTVKASKDSQTHTLRFVADDTWTESTLNWNNRPTGSTILDTVPGSAAADTVVSFDVTSQLDIERAGDGLISLVIAANNNDFSNYYSKEAADPADAPVLEVVLSGGAPLVLAPTITNGGAATGTYATPFSFQIAAESESTELSYSTAGLPAGLVVDSLTGAITGTPAQTGDFAVELTATNEGGSTTANLDLHIAPAAAGLELAALWQFYDGLPRPVSFTTTPAALPVELSYDGASAVPTYPGDYTVTASVMDPNYTGTATAVLQIRAAAQSHRAPVLNGTVEGSLQVNAASSFTLNSGALVAHDLLVAGQPQLVRNGQPTIGAELTGPGAATPENYRVTLNGGATVGYLVRQVDPVALPAPVTVLPPTGTRHVVLNRSTDPVGDFATLRHLTLNGNAGTIDVPPGHYGILTANGQSTLRLGNPTSDEPTVYHLQGLNLNSRTAIELVGPVVLNVATGFSFQGQIGNPAAPENLLLRVAGGSLNLNAQAQLHGFVEAPASTVTLNGQSLLSGGVVCDRLVLNSGSLLRLDAS